MNNKTSNILIIDDNEEIADMLTMVLSDEPAIHIEIITRSADFIKRLGEYSIDNLDLVIIDIMMPEYDGFQIIDAMNTNIQTKHIPKIVLSAYPSDENIRDSYKAGVRFFMEKPINVTEFYFLIKMQLKMKMYEDINRKIIQSLQLKNKVLQHKIYGGKSDRNVPEHFQESQIGDYVKDFENFTEIVKSIELSSIRMQSQLDKIDVPDSFTAELQNISINTEHLKRYIKEFNEIDILFKSLYEVNPF